MSVNVYDSESKELTRIAGNTLYADAPVGAIISYGGSTAPSGWLLCQGQAVSRTTYADLFKAIGTAFGSGDGSTTFNVPDLREATTKGVGLSGKSSSHYDSDGVALGEFVEDRLQEHEHKIYFRTNLGTEYLAGGGSQGGNFSEYNGNKVINARVGNTTEVKAVGVNYIIKALQVGIPQNVLDYVNTYVDQKINAETYPKTWISRYCDTEIVYKFTFNNSTQCHFLLNIGYGGDVLMGIHTRANRVTAVQLGQRDIGSDGPTNPTIRANENATAVYVRVAADTPLTIVQLYKSAYNNASISMASVSATDSDYLAADIITVRRL